MKKFDITQLEQSLSNNWEQCIQHNNEKGTTYFIYRTIDTDELCLSGCTLGTKLARSNKRAKVINTNITKMLNDNPIENKEKYIKQIVKKIKRSKSRCVKNAQV